jgi:hypothetical protein
LVRVPRFQRFRKVSEVLRGSQHAQTANPSLLALARPRPPRVVLVARGALLPPRGLASPRLAPRFGSYFSLAHHARYGVEVWCGGRSRHSVDAAICPRRQRQCSPSAPRSLRWTGPNCTRGSSEMQRTRSGSRCETCPLPSPSLPTAPQPPRHMRVDLRNARHASPCLGIGIGPLYPNTDVTCLTFRRSYLYRIIKTEFRQMQKSATKVHVVHGSTLGSNSRLPSPLFSNPKP